MEHSEAMSLAYNQKSEFCISRKALYVEKPMNGEDDFEKERK